MMAKLAVLSQTQSCENNHVLTCLLYAVSYRVGALGPHNQSHRPCPPPPPLCFHTCAQSPNQPPVDEPKNTERRRRRRRGGVRSEEETQRKRRRSSNRRGRGRGGGGPGDECADSSGEENVSVRNKHLLSLTLDFRRARALKPVSFFLSDTDFTLGFYCARESDSFGGIIL